MSKMQYDPKDPINKWIIIIEYIDCIIDIIKNRNDDDTKINQSNENNIDEIFKLAIINDYNKRNIDGDGKLTLSCILNTIDSIFEQSARIMIITTNYKNKLDNALIRSGKIDMKINFTKCTNKMTKNTRWWNIFRLSPLLKKVLTIQPTLRVFQTGIEKVFLTIVFFLFYL